MVSWLVYTSVTMWMKAAFLLRAGVEEGQRLLILTTTRLLIVFPLPSFLQIPWKFLATRPSFAIAVILDFSPRLEISALRSMEATTRLSPT